MRCCWFLVLLCLLASSSVSAAEGAQGSAISRITLEVKDMDVVELLRLLADKGGLDVVAGSGVRGTVTMFLKDVEIEAAIRTILEANGLACERSGDLLVVMTAKEYEAGYGERFVARTEMEAVELRYARAAEVAKTLQGLKSDVGRIVVDEGTNQLVLVDQPQRLARLVAMAQQLDRVVQTQTFELRYATVEAVAPKVLEMLTKGIGSLAADERTGRLVVRDYPDALVRVTEAVHLWDARPQEVLIEARMIQVVLSDEHRSGIDWEAVFRGVDAELSQMMPLQASVAATATSGASVGALRIGTIASHRVTALVRAIESVGKTETLSSPRIVAVDRQPAKILVGTKEAFVTSTTTVPSTGSTVTSDSVQFVDVGVSLAVTPSIGSDGYVMMQVEPEVSTVDREVTTTDASGNVRSRVPIVRTQQTQTTVVVRDGDTMVLGGLMEERSFDEVNRVPIVGYVPWLGRLFQNRARSTRKTELIILLTPRIQREPLPDR